ncbi:hypothetical protein ACQQ62_03985 [Corynebacterium diphtheriae]
MHPRSKLPMSNAAIMSESTVDSVPKIFDNEKPPADDPDSEVFESSEPSCLFLSLSKADSSLDSFTAGGLLESTSLTKE